MVKAEARSVRFQSIHICGECDLNLLTLCCSVLQCVAVCCSVLQCVAVCRPLSQVSPSYVGSACVLHCVAVCCSVLQCVGLFPNSLLTMWCDVCGGGAEGWIVHESKRVQDIPRRLPPPFMSVCVRTLMSVCVSTQTHRSNCVGGCVSVTRPVCCSVLQCVAVCCSVLHCVVVWCSAVQCVCMQRNTIH